MPFDLFSLTLCRTDGPVIKYPQFWDDLNASNVQPLKIMLLSPRLQKLQAGSLVVLHWKIFLTTGPFVKKNNTSFTNVSSFTFTHSTYFTLSCRILLISLPTSNNVFQSVYSDIPGQSVWWVLFRPLWFVVILWQWRSLDLTWFYSGLLISRTFLIVQKALVLYFFVCI
jgi:hypothetical protein